MSTTSSAARSVPLPAATARLPRAPGVYRFRDDHGRILYLGRATDLRSRVRSYWGNLGERRHLSAMVGRVARIEALACASVHEAAWLERNLLEAAMPPWNRTPGGQETPVYIVVDDRPRSAGIRLSHSAGIRLSHSAGIRLSHSAGIRLSHSAGAAVPATFGPYLGGIKAQQAISGLHRAFPLAYAGERLTAAERDIAAKRGVGPTDRERLAAAIAATLDRTDGSVARAALEAARDRAAASLSFELAGRIQDELAAIDWVTSPQRVTVAGGGDQRVCGWAEGFAVAFTIRAGRLDGWRQRACSQRAVAACVAATPEMWGEFATRNAELAVALARA